LHGSTRTHSSANSVVPIRSGVACIFDTWRDGTRALFVGQRRAKRRSSFPRAPHRNRLLACRARAARERRLARCHGEECLLMRKTRAARLPTTQTASRASLAAAA
jgi:hypothetical protein